jgi:hypothetical protein
MGITKSDELKDMMAVNTAARNQRLKIEDSLKLDPFIDHLYSEQQFEHLIFIECRRTNMLLEELIGLLSDACSEAENPKKGAKPIPSMKSFLKEIVDTSTELSPYEQQIDVASPAPKKTTRARRK